MKNIILTLFAMLLLFACEKKDESLLQPTVNTSPSLYVKDGAIHFESDSAFLEICDKIMGMDESEFLIWEHNIGFNSLRSHQNMVMDKIAKCGDSITMENLIKSNNDIIECVDSVIVPKTKSIVYSSISDRKGIFYIGSVIHKVQGGRIAVSADGDKETVNRALNEKYNGSLSNGVRLYSYELSDRTDLKSASYDVYGRTAVSSSFTNGSNSTRCTIEQSVYNIWYSDISAYGGLLYSWHWAATQVTVSNYKKSWGKYRLYNTTCELRDMEYTIHAPKFINSNLEYVDISGTLPDQSSGNTEVKEMSQSSWVGDRVNESYFGGQHVYLAAPTIKRIRAKATNRGIGAYWATIVIGN